MRCCCCGKRSKTDLSTLAYGCLPARLPAWLSDIDYFLPACAQPYLSPVQEGMVYTHPGSAYLQPQQQQYMAIPPMAMYQQQMQYEDARASLDANAGKEEGGLQMACCSEATV